MEPLVDAARRDRHRRRQRLARRLPRVRRGPARAARSAAAATAASRSAATSAPPHGTAPYVLLLNPDARIDAATLAPSCARSTMTPSLGVAGPRILGDDGVVARTQRNFPRLRSTWAQALFLHRISPHARWADEVIWDPRAYERPGAPEWLSGACLLIRRSALERIGGIDERFFLYCEDIDLCRRLRDAGHEVALRASRDRAATSAARPRPRDDDARDLRAQPRLVRAQALPSRRSCRSSGSASPLGELTHARRRRARGRRRRAARRSRCAPSSPGRARGQTCMCGITGAFSARPGCRGPAARRRSAAADDRDHRAPRARRRGLRARGRPRARRAPPEHRRRRRRPSADGQRGPGRSGAPRTARSTTTTSCATRLRADGHEFRTRCDTEVLPHLYEVHGAAPLRRAARQVRDRGLGHEAQRGVIARDRLGIKPLYYAEVDGARRLRLRAQVRDRQRPGRATSSTSRRSPPTSRWASSRRR